MSRITIYFLDGTEKEFISDYYGIKDGVFYVKTAYRQTENYPLYNIKYYKVEG